MVDSKAKGARAESKVKDELRALTKLDWQRTPLSGALASNHKLKGDLYIPDHNNKYCVEVKHYADDHLTSKLLTDKVPQFTDWWLQTLREAAEVKKTPLLIFKFDRSKLFVAFQEERAKMDLITERWIYLGDYDCYVMVLPAWIKALRPEF